MRAKLVPAVVAAVAIGLGVTAIAIAARGGGGAGDTVVLELTWQLAAAEEVDSGRPGRSPGDTLIRRFEVLEDGQPVGSGQTTCVLNHESFVMCIHQMALAERGNLASLHLGDQSSGESTVTDAIVGGTGEFRNARGEVMLDLSGEGNDVRVVATVIR